MALAIDTGVVGGTTMHQASTTGSEITTAGPRGT